MNQSQLSVLHILTSSKGGAAVAASELNFGMVEKGLNSKLVVNFNREPEIKILSTDFLYKPRLHTRLKSKTLTFFQRTLVQSTNDLVTTLGIKAFYDNKVLRSALILHIHSTYNFLSTKQLLELASEGKGMVIHLHDQRFITGGCHHDRGCQEFLRECNNCPMVKKPFRKIVIEEKKRINKLLAMKNIVIVAPSRFLLSKAQEMFPENLDKISFIPNLSPRKITRDISHRKVLRESLGIAENMFVLGFSAANLESPFKNFGYFKEIAHNLAVVLKNKDISFRVLIVGAGTKLEIDDRVINIGSVNSYRARELLSAMDLLLVTSSIDNTPNVIIESLLEGTPALGTRVGGIPELLAHLEDWPYLSGDLSKDLSTILSFQERRIQREFIQNTSMKFFNREETISKYIELYNKVRNNGL